MPQSDWFHQKAAECERCAEAADDPVAQLKFARDQVNWTQIAEGIEAREAAATSDADPK
jgi:hypothetical protein